MNKWWKALLIGILILPIFGVSGLLVGYLLGRVDPGQWSMVEWLIAPVVTYLIFKLISPKSTLSISRSSIKDIRQMGDTKISFDAIHPEKEKVGTIIVKFKSFDKAKNFMNGI